MTTIAPTVTVLGNRHEPPASFDTALLGVFWTTLAAWAHGTALARAHGIDGKSIDAQLTAMVQLAADIGPGFARDADNRTYPADTSTIISARNDDAARDHRIERRRRGLVSPRGRDGALRTRGERA
ncbi:hypothetical protein R4P65_30930 [Rhodococcus sp. IEGM 1318]|nr:hypothetical protein [Rhodococcus sp. IEGM 1318]MDV8009263.1 hypothetical protein [Rhodococcus sp. IEGM 1318]